MASIDSNSLFIVVGPKGPQPSKDRKLALLWHKYTIHSIPSRSDRGHSHRGSIDLHTHDLIHPIFRLRNVMDNAASCPVDRHSVPTNNASGPFNDDKRRIEDVWEPLISPITPDIFIGNSYSSCDRATLRDNHINSMLSLLDYQIARWQKSVVTDYIKKGRHLEILCSDSKTQDLLIHMKQICDFIDQMLLPLPAAQSPLLLLWKNATTSDQESFQNNCHAGIGPSRPGVILVHCKIGISRSATAIVAYLMRKQRKTRDHVLREVQTKHPWANPSSNFMAQLSIWEQVGYQIWEDEEGKMPKPEYAAFLEERAARLEAKRANKRNGLPGRVE